MQSRYANYTGAWSAKYLGTREVPYASARVWGTGVNPVHEIHGEGPPLRTLGREGHTGAAGYEGQPAAESVPEQLTIPADWYYCTDEPTTNYYFTQDARPDWSVPTADFRGNTLDHPQWSPGNFGTTTAESARFREEMEGAHRYHVEDNRGNAEPNETVSEGWLNKPQGSPADSKPSDPSQYEIQTAMAQRYQTRVNDHAVARGTDEPRHGIFSRVIGQRLKVYSEGERHYDMDPYQQDELLRPFYYRHAGTGEPALMMPNEMYVSSPLQRTPPADPSLGAEEASSSDYGYTSEDLGYAY